MKDIFLLFLILFSISCSGKNTHPVQQNPILDDSNTSTHGSIEEDMGNDITSYERDDNLNLDNEVIGVWCTEFPIPSSANGFGFFPNGLFVYCDYSDMVNIDSKYDGALGAWKVENNEIWVRVISHYYWQNPYVETPFGFIVDEKNILLHDKSTHNDWICIGEMIIEKTNINDEEIKTLELNYFQNSVVKPKKIFFQTKGIKAIEGGTAGPISLDDDLYEKMIYEITG